MNVCCVRFSHVNVYDIVSCALACVCVGLCVYLLLLLFVMCRKLQLFRILTCSHFGQSSRLLSNLIQYWTKSFRFNSIHRHSLRLCTPIFHANELSNTIFFFLLRFFLFFVRIDGGFCLSLYACLISTNNNNTNKNCVCVFVLMKISRNIKKKQKFVCVKYCKPRNLSIFHDIGIVLELQ